MTLSQVQPGLAGAAPADSAPCARLTVRLAAVAANYRALARRAAPAAIAPVVKADAYGVGLAPVVRTLLAYGAGSFFVARAEEGAELRKFAPAARIFVLDGLLPGTAAYFGAHRLIPVLNAPEEIAEWSDFARASRTTCDAALQIDTGMNRSGLSLEDTAKLAADARGALAGIDLVLVMSHLACADEPENPLNREQLGRFRAALARLPPAPASFAATAGIELGRDYLFDVVRPGLGLYGGNPLAGRPNPYRSVLELTAEILQLRRVAAGESVGYGATFTAAKETMLAVAPLGYADGLIRAMGPRGYAMVGGVRAPFAGRVSMDLITLDVTDVPAGKAARGAKVEFLGERIALEDLARAAGTINHEVLTALSPRAMRVYKEA